MTDVSDVSDAAPEGTPSPIRPARHISARQLSRDTASLLRQVADEDLSFAVRHFGRVVGFLVPLAGRVPKQQGGGLVYEVEVAPPLIELTEVQRAILRNLVAGPLIDPGVGLDLSGAQLLGELATMTSLKGLVAQAGGRWRITEFGKRHVAG